MDINIDILINEFFIHAGLIRELRRLEEAL